MINNKELLEKMTADEEMLCNFESWIEMHKDEIDTVVYESVIDLLESYICQLDEYIY